MNSVELAEASAILRRLVTALEGASTDAGTQAAAQFRSACGQIVAGAEGLVSTGNVGPALKDAFDALFTAGTTYDALSQLRRGAATERPLGAPGAVITNLFVILALACQSKVLAASDFNVRSAVDAYLADMSAAFDLAEDYAADLEDSATYRAIITLHAAVTRDLSARGRQLPRIVPYAFSRRVPALWLSNRLYGDGSRADELASQNSAVHPLFMPSSGQALSR